MRYSDELNEKQAAFAEEYIRTLNITEAAKLAGYSEKTAHVQGSKLLKLPKIKAYVNERLENSQNERVAKSDEVLEYLTSVMRGELKDQLGFETAIKDRNKAAELLGKRYGLYIDKSESTVNVGVKIVDDIE